MTTKDHPPAAGFSSVVQEGVLELAFNRPERRNPLDYATIEALAGSLRAADEDPSIRCVLIRGEGKGFTAGADLAEMASQLDGSPLRYHETGAAWVDLLTLIPRLAIPVVAAPHGFAMAGGLGIVAAADVAVASEGTTFATSEIKIGLFPLMILPTLQRAIGARQAGELALTGRRIDEQDALRMGLVHRVLPHEGFVDSVREIARELAALGSTTMALGKAYLRDIDALPLEAATQLGRAVRGAFMTSPDFAEGLSAFLDKRPPRFQQHQPAGGNP